MKRYVSNFIKFRPLLEELVSRDIKTKYRRSILGVLWTILNPLFMMIVLSIVFSNLFKFQIENFPIYILSGQVIYNFFSEATSMAMSSIIDNGSLIKKVYIPKYLFTVSRVISSSINLLASFCALVMVMIAMRVELHYTIVLAIIPMLLIIFFSMGVGLLLAAFAVKFRDIMHLYSVLLTALMYMTPIIYPMSLLSGKIRTIVELNPLTHIVMMFRDVVMSNTLPDLKNVFMAVIPTIIVLILGLYAFYKRQDSFIMEI